MIFVTKRNGKRKPYDKRFIQIAIGKAEKELYGKESDLSITVADEVTNYILTHNIKVISVEQIEDRLLKILKKKNKTDVAKAYEEYRNKRENQRKHLIDKQILDLIDGSNEFLAKENANKNSTLVSTQRDLMAGTISRNLSLRFKIPQFLVDAHNEGLIKLHDLDYFLNPETNCVEENGWICFKDEDGVRNIQLKDLQKILNITANGTFKINKKCYVLGRNGWTRLLAISVRDTKENEPIYEFSTYNGINLKTTGEHRIPVIRNNEEVLLEAKDIQKGDELLSSNGLTINPYEYSNFVNRKIKDIKIRTYNTKVYDLQTDTGWFIVNDYVVHNCCLIPLDDLFTNGTVINNVKITTPKSLMTATTLATQIITQVTSHQYGGCTISLSHLAPYVRVSFNKYKRLVREEEQEEGNNCNEAEIERRANRRLKKEIKDSVQTFNYQINTMSSTNGRLAVYSGNIINY